MTSYLDTTATVEVDEAGRVLIVGYPIRWGQAGSTSAGRLTFDQKDVEIPSDASRVKLLVEHETKRHVVGHGFELTPDDKGLHSIFLVPDPDRASALEAVQDVRLKLRDSFSPGVELDDATRLRLHRGRQSPGPEKGAGRLREVSLVVVPGFDGWSPA